MAKQENQSPEPSPLVALTKEQLDGLLALATSQQDKSPQLLEAIKGMTALAEGVAASTQGLREEVGRTVRRFNADHENISVFTFDKDCEACKTKTRHSEEMGGKMGHPEEKFRFKEVYFPANARIWADQCSIAEVRLVNAFTKNYSSRNGHLKAVISPEGDKLFIHADVHGPDARGNYGPFALILTELLHGEDMIDPANTLAMIAALQSEVAALKAKSNPVPA